jgi:NAD-dependent SIR2 family protein deacetylase
MLQHAHRKGKLVFFCGAGVSNYSDELPKHFGSFHALCEALLEHFSPRADKASHYEQRLKDNRYEELLQNLAKEYGTKAVTAQLRELFRNNSQDPDWQPHQHKTLLRLASHQSDLRLVTTNFDGLFNLAYTKLQDRYPQAWGSLTLNEQAAPALPIPRSDEWNSLVYLHGKADDPASRLIYS